MTKHRDAFYDTDTQGSEPIAIVGIGCRFAGGIVDLDSYWQMLAQGRDGLCEVPADRWAIEDWFDPNRDAPGKMNFRRAGFLRDGIDQFDASFFEIAPREAAQMDPQQRLFLELAHEALEDAGVPPDGLGTQSAGIFAGSYFGNYTMMARGAPDPDLINGWSATGGHSSVTAGRLAYYLGTTGPALMVDTACSSSLVAVHLAVQSLRLGECDLALSGGVHLLTSPEPLVASTKLGATAPDGQCKVFDSNADGFGHGEGGAILVLKRLDDAQANGDRVVAVIRGTAVNQDGRSNSLTAPNGPSQERVIQAALTDANLGPEAVSYVEAHGTGTAMGDPIEVEALGRVLRPQSTAPLMIGSAKGNIGHTEAASGVAGLVKAALVLRHGQVPPQCGFQSLNPEIDALGMPVKVPTDLTSLGTADHPFVVGVSAFGFSGTNAHVVLQAPDLAVQKKTADAEVLAVSARTPEALDQAVADWTECLRARPDAFAALARTSTAGRRHWGHRLALVAQDSSDALTALQAAPRYAPTTAPKIGFLFTGQGSQYAGMAKALFDEEPAFRSALEGHFATLDALCGWDSHALIFGDQSIDDTDKAQPLLVAIELALAAFWKSVGIIPSAVMGHSVGEISAAAVCGAISEHDALCFAAVRGQAMQALPSGGGMMAIFTSEAEVAPLVTEVADDLSIAALNGPLSTVVAGPIRALKVLEKLCEANGLDVRDLSVSHAFHSSLIAPALPALQEAAEKLTYAKAKIPLISNVSAAPVSALTADYWGDHALRPVRFGDSLRAMADLGVDLCIEVGPDAVLSALARSSAPDLRCIPSLRRARPDGTTMAQAMAELYTAGAAIDWQSRRRGMSPVDAPLTRFQRSRHWLDVPTAAPRQIQPKTASVTPALETTEQGSALIYDFYDELTVISQNYTDAVDGEIHEEGHLTFGLLPAATPGFSWVRALFERDLDPDGHALLRHTQGALKEAIFADIDFADIKNVFDYGCGHAADLASLVLEHPHVRGRGYTISAGQVDVGRKRLASLGLSDRITVERADSSKTAFPKGTDLIFGVEVTGLIGDKEGLFANIANGLADGGLLVIADFIATDETIANPDTHSYTPIAEEWAELLGRHKLRLVRALDASVPVARWLDDPDFAGNIDALVARYGLSDLTRRHLLSNGNIGNALRADLMRYMLMRAVASPRETVEAVTAANLALLQNSPVWEPETGSDVGWTYKVQDVATPTHPKLDPPTLVAAISGAISRETKALCEHAGAGAAVEGLAKGYLHAALRELGAKNAGDMANLSVAPQHGRLLAHLNGLLDDPATPIPDPGDLSTKHANVAAEFPAAAAELRLLERCGTALAPALRGEVNPLDLLFPDGDSSDAEALYERSPFSAALQRLGAELCKAIPRGNPLKVIEAGGGTGATTAHIRSTLPAGSTYTFTDLSPALVAKAAARFEAPDFATLPYDIEKPPAAGGLATGVFDLAVAANMLHATRDLGKALGHMFEMLAPGGMLLLVENTGPFLWGDLTFGLTPGMWAFDDDGTRSHALISPMDWQTALGAAGFEQISVLDPGNADIADISRQCVIVAQKPLHRWFVLHGPTKPASALTVALEKLGHSVVEDANDASDLVYLGTDKAISARDHVAAAHGCLSVDGAQRVTLISGGNASQAALEGLARGIAAEVPESNARSINLDAGSGFEDQLDAVTKSLLAARDTCWLGAEGTSSRALVPHTLNAQSQPELKANGCYLVTGAYGGLGPHLVRWLHGRGARSFILVGRNAPSHTVQSEFSEMDVTFEVGDLSDAETAKRLVDLAQASGGLRGVFHAAGALSDAALSQQTPETLAVPFAAKSEVVTVLADATAGIALDHFVVFSSVAGLLAPFGQANHAAAATALAALARDMNRQGRHVLCVDWGAFAQSGAAMQAGVQDKVAKTGLGFMPPAQAFDTLGQAMVSGETELAIVDADWAQYVTRYPVGGIPKLLEGLSVSKAKIAVPPLTETKAVAHDLSWQDRLEAAASGHRKDLLHDLIRAEAARILQLPEAELRDDAPLREAGLDSLMSIEFRNALSRATGIKLGATLVFDHPSVRDLAAHLSKGAFGDLFATQTANEDLESYDADALSKLLAAELNEAMGTD